jgi:hypothetical protein
MGCAGGKPLRELLDHVKIIAGYLGVDWTRHDGRQSCQQQRQSFANAGQFMRSR